MKRLYSILTFLLFVVVAHNAWSTIYYVSSTRGQNNLTRLQAQNINTPWLTIQKGLDSAAVGDTVWVLPGNYVEPDTIRRSVVLLGNGGSGAKPVVSAPLRPGASSVFTVRARNVVIRNFQLEFNQIFCIHGINADGNNVWNNLTVTDCRILSRGTGAPCLIFNSYGVYARGNNDSLTLSRNYIGPPDPFQFCVPGRAVWTSGIRAYIGGETKADSNVLLGYYGIQTAGNRGNWQVKNNKLYGIGLLFNTASTNNTTHLVYGNEFLGFAQLPLIAALEIREVSAPGVRLIVRGNYFNGYTGNGIFAGRSRNLIIDSNIFKPSIGASVAIHLNSKYQTSGNINNAFKNSSVITANRFLNPMDNQPGAIGIGIFDHIGASGDSAFQHMVIGGAGRDANWFNNKFTRAIYLDTNSRPSTTFSLWGTYPITNMRPVKVSVNAIGNMFELDSTVYKTPAQMTLEELFSIEGRFLHRTADSRTGFITVRPNSAYVSRLSYAEPFSSSPSLARGILSIPEGGTLFVEPDTLNERLDVSKSFTLAGRSGRVLVYDAINANISGKAITLANDVKLNGQVRLAGGVVNLGNQNLWLANGRNLIGGSATSHITTTGGMLYRLGFNADTIYTPLGINGNFAPAWITNLGNARIDTLVSGLRTVAPASNYQPAISSSITSHAGLQWTNKTSNNLGETAAAVRLEWPAASEVNGPLNNQTRLMGYTGTGWKRYSAAYNNQSITVSGVKGFEDFAVTADSRPVVLATGVVSRFLCSGRDSLDVQALSADTFASNNTFTFELSDASGSFATPIVLGTRADSLAPTVKFPLPSGMSFGNNYRVRVTSSNPAIVGDSSLATISLDSIPAKPSFSTVSSVSICLGDSVTFTAPAGYSYFWSTGERTQQITVSQSGKYALVIANSGRCTSPVSDSVTVIVTAFSGQPTISVLSGSTTFCQGDSIVLGGPAGFPAYRWSNGATTQNITIRTSGVYNLRVGQTARCLSDSSTTPIVVSVTPKPARPSITLFGDDTLLATAGGQRYEWYFNGTRIAGTTSILPDVNRSGLYQVIIIRGGCKSDTSAPFQFTVGLGQQISQHDVQLMPNPATTQVELTISTASFTTGQVRIYNSVGKLQRELSLEKDGEMLRSTINLDGLSRGVYMVEAITGGQRITKRLIVE